MDAGMESPPATGILMNYDGTDAGGTLWVARSNRQVACSISLVASSTLGQPCGLLVELAGLLIVTDWLLIVTGWSLVVICELLVATSFIKWVDVNGDCCLLFMVYNGG